MNKSKNTADAITVFLGAFIVWALTQALTAYLLTLCASILFGYSLSFSAALLAVVTFKLLIDS